ncbi:MAG: selenocysteine-specific translation elongation factor [Sphingomonadales bacterium]|nr:selenocysteine-specific translation elongation factor [Sphingomonadales bacterium]
MLVVTAGHIDHGKTALIRALTGAETDRLPEERRRGISIDLGFAYWRPDAGDMIGFIDVPGHERYVGNMLAGVGGVDLALLVIAADDGVMPQTREHVAMLDLLGIARAIVAITKADKADPARIAGVRAEIARLLAPTAIKAIAVHAVSAQNGTGIADLAAAVAAARRPAAHDDSRGLRLAIDRAFTVTGSGTVASGTIRQGRVAVGDRLTVIPAGREVRVRGLQIAGIGVTEAAAGMRCALNIAPVEAAELHRGDWLLDSRIAAETLAFSAEFTLAQTRGTGLRHCTQVNLHLGTAVLAARVLIARQATLLPGANEIVQFAFERRTHALAGDRFVVRDRSGQHLLGGGRVADPLPPRGRKRAQAQATIARCLLAPTPAKALAALLALPGIEIDGGWFARAFGLVPAAAQALVEASGAHRLGRDQSIILPAARHVAIAEAVVAELRATHAAQPELGGLTPRDLRQRLDDPLSSAAFTAILRELAASHRIETAAALLRIPGHQPSFSPAEVATWQAMCDEIGEGPPRPIVFDDLVRGLRMPASAVRAMLYRRRAAGEIWAVTETRFLLREHATALGDLCARLGAADPAGFTAADLRDASGIGRNFVIQLLEFFDRLGVTARRGDRRIMRADWDVILGAPDGGTSGRAQSPPRSSVS